MADFIILAALAVVVFFILRGHFRRLRGGQCSGGCGSCAGCSGCGVKVSGKAAKK